MISLFESAQGRVVLPKLAVSRFCWEGSIGTRTGLMIKGWDGSSSFSAMSFNKALEKKKHQA